jgi:glutamate N-acetyltransferase/amino-acid N-acetyltransferase
MSDAPDLTPVAGFRFAGIASGLKKREGALDLGAIVADSPVPTAAVFTRNRMKAAPVVLAASRLRSLEARAVLVNAGNANAATGKAGMEAAEKTTALLAEALDCEPADVVPCSTGVIGHVLPVEPFSRSMADLVGSLSPKGAGDFAMSILTTDKGPKVAEHTFEVGDVSYRMLAIGKGAGMVHPDMATTLAFVVTDAPVEGEALRAVLRQATDATFNRISVDGDTSTNDAIVAMASGQAGGKPLTGPGERAFLNAMTEALGAVAHQIVADGEGAQHVARIEVSGLRDSKGALQVARTVATSLLVKTAMHGKDPNWGRLLAAAGRAGVAFEPEKSQVWLGDVCIFEDGESLLDDETEAAAGQVMAAETYTIRLVLGTGDGSAYYDTCDLGHDYVTLNADYRT